MTESRQDTVAAEAEARFVAAARRELDQSCAALDGATLSRLNSIRHAALEGRQSRRHKALLLPFGGLVTACMLVVSVILLDPAPAPESQGETPLEDIELLTDTESFDFYEEYEFYQWLAENGSSI